ncbi:MAG TPA: SUMF1/EgtB/PvdO family nonheme iron enzyme [Kofleriaceae bacterium]|nr:SUMF1/EgtB/PvdO family nonheme iron enzyme [Kofleriaceae bacterium]
MNRILAIVAVGCSGGPVNHPGAANAQLSLAGDAQMIVIPAGRFVSGSTPEERAAAYDDYQTSSGQDAARTNKWFDGEDERHVVTLPAFRIDLMPVTQAQYSEFVAAGKAPAPTIDEATWKAQGFTQDYASQVVRFNWTDGRPPSGREDHPVVLVTWTEATNYCKWRGELRGESRRLPTAAEYEKAERGDGGLAYPWGNTFEADKLDSAVNGPHDTVPVGQYTTGASQYGVLGMAGNVFEWTSTPFDANKMTVKGSAWDDWAGIGRGASRHGRPSSTRHVIIGFRCAADAPIQ